ncbi:hypothetical protein AWZ03_008741 [Drosophila navojoa]|uniref:Uncharacterized protein n=3 Tax=Drosophila navojoa TaxID=7232 RepID=A0A484B877_DRONA|nr:hypothetical protein AWZ03_008741 [Drosophila navojoa]
MWCGKQGSGAESIGDWSLADREDAVDDDDNEQAPPTAIVIVEPRQMRLPTSSTTSSSNSSSMSNGIGLSHNNNNNASGGGGASGVGGASSSSNTSIGGHAPDWFMLPQAVDVNNDVMRLVSSLSTVVQILTRMTNAAAQELRQHPEREEGFQGLRLLLNYADQMYTTLLQPQPLPPERPASSNRNVSEQSYNLFHHLFEPMLVAHPERVEDVSARQSQPVDRSRAYPYRVVAVAASATGIPGGTPPGSEASGPIAPTSAIGANVYQIRN